MFTLLFLALTTCVLGALLLQGHGRRSLVPAPEGGAWDAIIVLGCDAPDGKAGSALRTRVEQAATLFHLGLAPMVVITGGLGTGEQSEAAAGGRVARDLGIPGSALVLEDRAANTQQNAEYSGPLVEGSRFLVVTDAYHVFRSRRLFRRHFRPIGDGAELQLRFVASFDANTWVRWRGALREVLAVFFYLLTRRI